MHTRDVRELKFLNRWRLNKGSWEYFLHGKYISTSLSMLRTLVKNFLNKVQGF